MYCRNCGAELSEDAKFCSKCGTKVQQSSGGKVTKEDVTVAVGKIMQASRQAGGELRQKLEEAYGEKLAQKPDAAGEKQQETKQQETGRTDTATMPTDQPDAGATDVAQADMGNGSSAQTNADQMNAGGTNAGQTDTGQKNAGQAYADPANTAQAESGQPKGRTAGQTQEKDGNGRFSKVWNHPIFTMVAVKFGNLLDVLISIVGIWLAFRLFSEGGISGTLIGIVCLVGGICGRDLYIIPAGIHGVVVVPVGENTDIGFLKERAAEFLEQERNEADWLSGHLYRYIARRDVIEEVLP